MDGGRDIQQLLIGEVMLTCPGEGQDFRVFEIFGGIPALDKEDSFANQRAADKESEPYKKEPSEQIGISPSARGARNQLVS